MEQYRKQENNKYYLKELNSKTGELEWIEINLESTTEPVQELSENEMILNPPRHDYFFTHDDERPKDE